MHESSLQWTGTHRDTTTLPTFHHDHLNRGTSTYLPSQAGLCGGHIQSCIGSISFLHPALSRCNAFLAHAKEQYIHTPEEGHGLLSAPDYGSLESEKSSSNLELLLDQGVTTSSLQYTLTATRHPRKDHVNGTT